MLAPDATLLVTGGAGFIGSALVRELLDTTDHTVVTLDALTYAGHLASLEDVLDHPRHTFVRGDVADETTVDAAFAEHRPDAVLHLAAESHVDRSIDGPAEFLRSNVTGTFVLLQAARAAWGERRDVRFVHVSTDEVFGSLDPNDPPFRPKTRYDPRSPYAASKAASDHLARAWLHTYRLPTLVTNCANNYGPRQHPEKLVPTLIRKAAAGRELPIYGDGGQVRDWLHVRDHARGLTAAVQRGTPGTTYLFGARTERTNLQVAEAVCEAMNELHPDRAPHDRRIRHVDDRPGHDRRYAIDPSAAETELDWRPESTFRDGIRATIDWYLRNEAWTRTVLDGSDDLPRLGTAIAGDECVTR
ncbi:MAG: dTDP-glucose 4,6-dehydratase [Trueperaceae bacterium]